MRNISIPHQPSKILVRELHSAHREMIRTHLLQLEESDRRLRFGMAASNDFINSYVSGFNFDRDAFFGVFDSGLRIIGLAHLAYDKVGAAHSETAEFGVSVSVNGRGFGVGTALFKRAAIHARNTNITILYVHCLSSNAAMMHIAKKAGMNVEYSYGEADAFLRLPPGDQRTLISEAMQDQAAIIDYSIKEGFNRALRFGQLFMKSPQKT